jgi:hypothetical protein
MPAMASDGIHETDVTDDSTRMAAVWPPRSPARHHPP